MGRQRQATLLSLRALVRAKRVVQDGGRGSHGTTYRLAGTPCEACGDLCTSGRWCPACKTSMRHDRVRLHAALTAAEEDHRAGQMVSPTQLAAAFRVRLYATRDLEGRIAPGLADVLVRHQLVGAEWAYHAAQARARMED